jgi:drug/metabolite transporter (DMT)-like permease
MIKENRALAYMLFASLLFSFMGLFVKLLSTNMPSVEIVFFRNVFGVFIVGYSIYRTPLVQIGGKFWLLFFRGFIGFLALLLFFYNISVISLAEAMTFSKTSPIFSAIFGIILLKEHLTLKSWVGIFIGFIGIVLVIQPQFAISKTDYFGILMGVGAALAYTSIRELKNYYDTRSIVLSFMLTGTLVPLLFMTIAELYTQPSLDFMIAQFIMPSGVDWFYIVLLGVFSTYAQIYMTKAYSLSKAGIVGTVGYSNIVFSIVLAMLFLGESIPNIYVLLGIVAIVFSGYLVSKEKS